MSNEKVSIIMPSFNTAALIGYSIRSIIAQTYADWELLISDDGSSDDTVKIAEGFARDDNRIKVFSLEGNNGAGVARNNSIKHATGRYIAFCDSDDMWEPTKLEKQLRFMRENGYSFVFASYYTCTKEGRRTGCIVAPEKVSLNDTKRDDRIGFLTAIYDTEELGKFYMPILRKRQDWAYVLEILKKCRYAYALTEPLAVYRKGRKSISHNKFTLVKYNAKVYETVFGYSTLHAYLYLFFLFIPTYLMKRLRYKVFNIMHKKDIFDNK